MLTADLHNHTLYSYDGTDSAECIIKNAVRFGLDAVGISDHQFSVRARLGEYIQDIYSLRKKYKDKIKVLCALEIGTRPKPDDFSPSDSQYLDYCLFESLDSPIAMDFYEFLEWSKLFKCPIGLAHTDVFALSERYGVNVLEIMKKRNIFWELNLSGNYNYYYDFLTNEGKQRAVAESGVFVSLGSDTHNIADFDIGKLRRAAALCEKLHLTDVFGD